jgi:hypothetical protein
MKPFTTAPAAEMEILERALKHLENQGIVANVDRGQAVGRAHADAHVRIGYGEGDALYAVEIKCWLTPGNLGAVATRLHELGPAALLITDYATPPIAEKLKELDIPFADAAGNAYLRGPNFLIWLTGRRPHITRKPPRAGRAWQPAGLKLIFALLCNPDWFALGYRELAMRAGVANGTVGWVMRELNEQDFVTKTRKRMAARRLRNRRKLLARWVEIYAATFRQTTLIGLYKTENQDWWKALDTQRYEVLIGGETAAAILTEYLKPGIATIYAEDIPGKLIMD